MREKVDNTTNTALCFLKVTFQLKVLHRGGDKVNVARTKLANISIGNQTPSCKQIQSVFNILWPIAEVGNPLAKKQLIYEP